MRFVLAIFLLFSFTVSYSQGKWVTVVTQGTGYQSYKTFSELEDMIAEVKEQTKKGNYVTDMEYGNGEWKLVVSEDKSSSAQAWVTNGVFPKQWLNTQKERKWNITKLSYGQFNWIAVARDQTSLKPQKFNVLNSWQGVVQWLRDVWEENPRYNIEDIAYGNGQWGVLLNYVSADEHQIFTDSKEFPQAWIQQKFNDNYNISSIESDGEKWYVVMTRKATQKSEKVLSPADNFHSSEVKEEWDKNRRITSLVYHIDTDVEEFAEFVKQGQKSLNEKDYDLAILRFEAASDIDPSDGEIWNNLAWARYQKGDCNEALEEAKYSVSIKANYYNLHTLAMVLKCLGNDAEALAYINQSIDMYVRINGEFKKAEYYLDRAELKYATRDYTGAKADLNKAIGIEPYNKIVTIRVEDLKSKMN